MFSKALLTKAVTVKIAAAVCGLSVVGAATAAATNSLPHGLQQTAHSALGPIGVPAPKSTSKTEHDKDPAKGGDQDDKGDDATPHPGPTGSAAAKPSAGRGDPDGTDRDALDAAGAALLGDDGFRLCKAAGNDDRDDRGVELTAPDLQKLARAAGIPDAELARIKSRLDAERGEAQKRMQDFCTRLAQAEKDLRQGRKPHFPLPAPHPGDGWPTTWPSTWPSTWPTLPSAPGLPSKLPTHLPTGLPTSVPTGWPSGLPTDPQNPNDPVHMPSASISGSVGIGQH